MTTEQNATENRALIREIFLAHGFTIKDGQTDLKPYVYEAAEALIAAIGHPSQQPKLTLALPAFEKRRIVIVSDEMIDDERIVCVAIDDKNAKPAQPTPVPAGQVPAIVHDALLRAYSALVSCSIKKNSDFREDQFYFNEVKVRDAMQAIKPILDATPAAPQPEGK